MACVAVISLVRTLELEFLQPQPRPILLENELIVGNKELIESLCEKLEFLMEQFDEKRMDGVEAIKDLETKLKDVAFRVEDEIELQVVDLYVDKAHRFRKLHHMFHKAKGKPNPHLRLHHILQQAIEDIDHIKEELVKVKNEYEHVIVLQRKTTLDVLPKSDKVIMVGASSSHDASISEDIMIGKNNEFQTIKGMLIEHSSKQREVVSIKGMGGIGKTTLARQIYDDSSVVSHSDKRAWVVVSQFHNKRQILVCLLNSIFEQGRGESYADEDPAEQIYRGLKRQRYLVVMDDVWSRGAWDDVNACFPDDRNGSRVVLTTRLEEVANHASSNNDFSHQMHLLDQNESWDLFLEKVLLKGMTCGGEFEMIGRPIVEKCRGLPLAIVVAAGLFSKLNTLDEWENIAKALNSSTTTIAEACSRILSLSYNHLPCNLKACFLYFGVFPEDEVIDANNLARLWAAEGFVKTCRNESFQTVAERCIQELKDRNLIIKSEPSSNGRKMKRFRIHDVLHAFCVKEAENENLLHIVSGNNFNFPQKGFRWISIQSSNFDVQKLYSSSKNCRSILYFSKFKIPHLNLQNFNILRVFYTTHTNLCYGEKRKVTHLIHLRYLSSSMVKIFNSKQFGAWNLHTLCVENKFKNSHCSLDFPHLCYLSSGHRSDTIYTPKFVLQNLPSIKLELYGCREYLFTNTPCLKKVCIGIVVPPECTLWCIRCIGNLANLQQLESLKVCVFLMEVRYSIIIQIALLKNLKKLSFIYTSFRWEEINVLSMLPRLEVLKLGRYACEDREWKLREEEKFLQLIYLKFDEPDLEYWEASEDHFPNLDSLVMQNCGLNAIPSSFAYISTLKSIELRRCLPSAVISARQIQEEQHDQGNDGMVVIER